MDIRDYNRDAWDRQVARGNRWTVPVGTEVIERARRGEWSIVLTPTKPVPRAWFPKLDGARTLCLASGGGQQGPILAAAGARVTVFDNSPAQLAQDRLVAERDGLELATVEGDMRELSAFAARSFDLVVHPCSNAFVPDVLPVWREVARVLAPGGVLLAGFVNPAYYVFDESAAERGELVVRHPLPYSDATRLDDAERAALVAADEPFVFSHSLEELLGGQLEAGLALTHLFEDAKSDALSKFLPLYLATRAVRV
ncbi:MAG: class I SAM-dependent methyltransferase [Planctomycetes bacterium]|nr:class I SAM-dependent methyltransferase [Planctomycetota bacterium]